jgi:hypothetical protein
MISPNIFEADRARFAILFLRQLQASWVASGRFSEVRVPVHGSEQQVTGQLTSRLCCLIVENRRLGPNFCHLLRFARSVPGFLRQIFG